MYNSSRKEEIKTIKDRTVTLRLSDVDCVRLAQTAGAVGLSVGDLLKFFIGDLINGTFSNGSDERDLAQQWFDRCGFTQTADKTFLRWLIYNSEIDEFIGHYELLKECEADLKALHPDNSEAENLAEIEYQTKWLAECYHEYATGGFVETPFEDYEAAVKRVLEWDRDLRSLKGDEWWIHHFRDNEIETVAPAKPSDSLPPIHEESFEFEM